MDPTLVAALVAVAVGLAVPAIVFALFRGRIERIMAVARSLESLETEARTLAREFGELSDRNIARLERGTEELERLLGRVRTPGATLPDGRQVSPEGGTRKRETHDEEPEQLRSGVDGIRMAVREERAETQSPFPGERPRSACPEATGTDGDGVDGRREPILLDFGRAGGPDRPVALRMRPVRTEAIDLYRSGLSPDAIAGRLGMSIAEVELIVGLEERRGNPPRSRS